MEINSELENDLSGGGAGGDIKHSDFFLVQDKNGIVASQCDAEGFNARYTQDDLLDDGVSLHCTYMDGELTSASGYTLLGVNSSNCDPLKLAYHKFESPFLDDASSEGQVAIPSFIGSMLDYEMMSSLSYLKNKCLGF